MKENQIYKWFWELKIKQQDGVEAEAVTKHVSELTDRQRLEAFVNKSLKQYRD